MAKRHGAEFWQRHLEVWHGSSLTQEAYCANHGLTVKSFGRWRRKEREAEKAGKTSVTLVPVSVGLPVVDSWVRIQSPGGWRVELASVSAAIRSDLLRTLP
jgi:hypothetical protein